MAAIQSIITPCPIITSPSSLSKPTRSSVAKFCHFTSEIRGKHTLRVIPSASSIPATNYSQTKIEGVPSKVLNDDDCSDVPNVFIESVLNDDDCSDVPNVFIDESTGIVCYQTDCGEVVCEGLDEGPHFYPPSRSNYYMPDTRASAILPFFGEGMYEI